MQTNSAAYDAIQALSGPFIIVFLLAIAWVVVWIMFFIKIWIACSDVGRIKDFVDNMAYWENARYASEKRRGIIIEEDLQVADKVSQNK